MSEILSIRDSLDSIYKRSNTIINRRYSIYGEFDRGVWEKEKEIEESKKDIEVREKQLKYLKIRLTDSIKDA